jgi:hypothetical protein
LCIYYSKIISSQPVKFNLGGQIVPFFAMRHKNGAIYQNLTAKTGPGGLKTACIMDKLSYVSVGTRFERVLTSPDMLIANEEV